MAQLGVAGAIGVELAGHQPKFCGFELGVERLADHSTVQSPSGPSQREVSGEFPAVGCLSNGLSPSSHLDGQLV